MKETAADLRAKLKATSIKSLRKQVDTENGMMGVGSNEYLNLEDGKTVRIRIFPAHPGEENFYISKKAYWLTVAGNDGEMRRTQVLDARFHGGSRMDLVDEYVSWAKKKCRNDVDKLEAITATGPKSESLTPSYSWLCYADVVSEELKPKLWEFKKMVRDGLNKLAFSEDEDEAIEIDPFTDPDEGLPVLVTYRKNPNRKKGENYYEVAFPKKPQPRALTDKEIEDFLQMKPLSEVLPKYGIKDFERALEGLQNFDETNEIGLFEDEDWIKHVADVKAQYEETEEERVTSAPAEPEVDDEEEEEEELEEEEESGDLFARFDRAALKKYIRDKGLEVTVKKSMTDEDLRNAIRAAVNESETPYNTEPGIPEAEDEEEAPKARISLADIKAKLASRKK